MLEIKADRILGCAREIKYRNKRWRYVEPCFIAWYDSRNYGAVYAEL
jgi:hypothetical protein